MKDSNIVAIESSPIRERGDEGMDLLGIEGRRAEWSAGNGEA